MEIIKRYVIIMSEDKVQMVSFRRSIYQKNELNGFSIVGKVIKAIRELEL